jgi:GMP synthase (glutamine-hydrolysing)
MSLLVFQHVAHESPAALATVLQRHGHRLRVIRLDLGDSVPEDLDDVDGVISMGGPMNVDQADEHPWIDKELEVLRQAHETGLPLLGICLGCQLIAHALGGEVAPMPQPEIGWHPIKQTFFGTNDTLHNGVPWQTIQVHAHAMEVTKLPAAGVPLASSTTCRNQAFRVGLRTYGFQYHFEWTRADLDQLSRDSLFERSEQTPQQFREQIDTHYHNYRRLGDRLAANIALFLFPIDKR